jgi:outer membrane protein TolC
MRIKAAGMINVCSKATSKGPPPRRYILVLVIFFVFSHPYAGFTGEKKLTLTDSIRTALEENYELRAMKNAVLARKEGIDVARSAFLPKITFEERAMRTNNPPLSFMMKLNQQRFSQSDFILDALNNPQPINDYQTTFSLEQPVFSVKSYWGLSQAHNEHTAKNSEYNRKREETTFKVVQAYLRLHTAREYVRVSKKSIEDADEHVRIAEARYRTTSVCTLIR